MIVKFEKWHGIGNDFLVIDNRNGSSMLFPEQIRALCDRHFGVGADAVILYEDSEVADAKMNYFNADGSAAQTCGNGLRVTAAYGCEHGFLQASQVAIEKPDGTVDRIEIINRVPWEIAVDMGAPRWRSVPDFPDDFLQEPLTAVGHEFTGTCVSMGNPHLVLSLDAFTGFDLERIGRELEICPLFANRINVGFLRVISQSEAELRVWERGVGMTLACGSGAAAAVVAGTRAKKFRDNTPVLIHLPGGDLKLLWDRDRNTVIKTGAAQRVFQGEVEA